MNTVPQPLPCPLCGQAPSVETFDGDGDSCCATIHCSNPLCAGLRIGAPTSARAIERWNTCGGYETPQPSPVLETSAEPLPCPFCGDAPTVQTWVPPRANDPADCPKVLVNCGNDECPMECVCVAQNTRAAAIAAWNNRPFEEGVDELRDENTTLRREIANATLRAARVEQDKAEFIERHSRYVCRELRRLEERDSARLSEAKAWALATMFKEHLLKLDGILSGPGGDGPLLPALRRVIAAALTGEASPLRFPIGERVRLTEAAWRRLAVYAPSHADEFRDCVGTVIELARWPDGSVGPELYVQWDAHPARYPYLPADLERETARDPDAERCRFDTDGDGDCPVHPRGCPKP